MKQLLFFAGSILASVSLNAQTVTYQPFHGNYTNYGYHSQVWNGSEIIDIYDKTVWGNDTTVNNLTYIQIYRNTVYAGAVREDVATQQRYFLDPNNVEKNISISHFLNEGDMLTDSAVFLNAFRTYFDGGNNYLMFDTLVVGQVDSTLESNGNYSKTYYFEKPSDGLTFFVFNTYRGLLNMDQLENHMSLYCYRELDTQGPTGIALCDLGIDEADLLQIELFPNPATASFKLSGDLRLITDLSIYDISGQKVKQVPVSDINTEIFIGELKNGIYFLSANGNQKVLRFQKM